MAKDLRVSAETHKMLFLLKIGWALPSAEAVILQLKKDSDDLHKIRELEKHKLEHAGIEARYRLKEGKEH
jgi:hypothetical protein